MHALSFGWPQDAPAQGRRVTKPQSSPLGPAGGRGGPLRRSPGGRPPPGLGEAEAAYGCEHSGTGIVAVPGGARSSWCGPRPCGSPATMGFLRLDATAEEIRTDCRADTGRREHELDPVLEDGVVARPVRRPVE